ncbi:uncharacterized protein LOC108907567 [Anoplophora glabripennis]|uniref:uncharacterized protein LOC108907567 n=1 Tax=Anoplophora glabripennis TaxID=217634 RepID=UPI000874772A|nr:uncharacterized protein LOC108907567 [Anoplophora glabripennis]
MFWQCCRRSNADYSTRNGQDDSKKQNKNGSQESYDMDVRISSISTISNDSLNSNRNGFIPVSAKVGRVRTSSSSSVKSAESFYSVKSSATSARGDGDFYSICSVDSFKST